MLILDLLQIPGSAFLVFYFPFCPNLGRIAK
jgi:hypothetical protein